METEASLAAAQCIAIARKAWVAGNKEKATKFLSKSLRLHPTNQAKALLSVYSSQPARAPPPPAPEPSYKRPAPAQAKNYTPEQQALVKRISRTKDYYALLGLERNATEKDIKAAFRKTALKVHPDKNKAPGADNAFKAVNAAYGCLSDKTKRRHYNQTGSEESGPRHSNHSNRSNSYGQENVTPEDIFEHFFGFGDTSRGGRRRQRHQQRQEQQHDAGAGGQQGGGGGGAAALMTMLPIALLLIFTLLSNPSVSSSPFSLEQGGIHSFRRTTASNVVYFASPHFQNRYGRDPRTLATLEAQIEAEYLDSLREACNGDKHRRQEAMTKARKHTGPGKSDFLRQAYGMDLDNCHRLDAAMVF